MESAVNLEADRECERYQNLIGIDIQLLGLGYKILQLHSDVTAVADQKAAEEIASFSLGDNCTNQSDIDLAIISNIIHVKFLRSSNYNKFTTDLYNIDAEQIYDILQFNSMEDLKRRAVRYVRILVTKSRGEKTF